ncbi:MAG: hypothetical protein BWY31_04319 [Lentisphaerae bacterium ADurb.Bin242]|nr:MAG: hypothetical protein BWY31_04319 [Lentisphaerae bacterium ADurb.Bin242]
MKLYDYDLTREVEGTYPAEFRLVSFSPNPNRLAVIRKDGFALTYPGNRHALHARNIADFKLGFDLSPNSGDNPGFLIFFRYDEAAENALFIRIRNGIIQFGRLQGIEFNVISETKSSWKEASLSFTLETAGSTIRFMQGGNLLGEFAAPSSPSRGSIAFDTLTYGANECRIAHLTLEIPDAEVENIGRISMPMRHGPNGIPYGYVFTLERTKISGCEKWNVKLEGGPGNPDDWPVPRFMNAEIMKNPYCRGLDSCGNELFKIHIVNGSVGSWNILRATFGRPDFVFPVEHTAVVDTEGLVQIAFGYEFYQSEAAYSVGGGPSEILCGPDGKRIGFRRVYAPGECEGVIESNPDKAILERIPHDIPDYQDALDFARVNHFFLEHEIPRFKVFCVNEAATRAKITLEDIFKHEISSFSRKAGEFFEFPELPPGVYHIRAELFRNDLPLVSVRRTFEVIPDSPEKSAPALSGLPEIYPTGFTDDASEHFNPWGDTVCDVAHYSTSGNLYTYRAGAGYSKLLKVYHRVWASICDPDKNSESENCFIRKNASIVQSRILGEKSGRYYLHCESSYQDPWLAAQLREFAGRDLAFNELFPAHWREWLDFIAPRIRERFRSVNTFGPATKSAEYLAAATYGAIYKGPNYSRLIGIDLRNGKYGEILNGYAVVEDYPYAGRYPLSRSTWQFTSFSMEAPDVRWLPEIYGINAETMDPRIAYSHPPYGMSTTPDGFFFTRVTELLFGTAWFDGSKFRFWNGFGFLHSSEWTPGMFDALLRAIAFYREAGPVKPLRSPAYVYSRAACDAHEYFHERNERFIRGGSMINTAEEFPAYVYEMARRDGQPGGFQTRMEWLSGLNPDDVSALVLPPLGGVPENELAEVRRLHENGVNLLCSENAASLADLFDVEHADVLLEKDGAPFLTLKRSEGKLAAFFRGAPSMMKRGRDCVGGSGQKALDPEVNRATVEVMRILGAYPVTASCGSITAFETEDRRGYAFIREDSWPAPGHRIRPEIFFKGRHVADLELDEGESRIVRLY